MILLNGRRGRSIARPRKNERNCPHLDCPIAAKGLCCACYKWQWRRAKGIAPRVKRNAWDCEHTDRFNHTRGKCEPCAKKSWYDSCPEAAREISRASKIKNPPDRKKEKRVQKEKNPNRDRIWYQKNRIDILSRMTCKRYGLSKDLLVYLFEKQNNKCPCGASFGEGYRSDSKRAWGVDHDHNCCPEQPTCGKCTRGILCYRCNIVLGFMKDEISLLPRHLQVYLSTYEVIS